MEVLIMKDSKHKIDNTKDKIAGKVKESVGKITNNEQLELQGKIQSAKSDIKKKMYNIGEGANEIKEDMARKLNDSIDKNKGNAKDK